MWGGTTPIPYAPGTRIAKASDRSQAGPMPAPHEPKLPSLLPFVVMALILLVLYGGLLLFPTLKGVVNRQDCVATGRTDC